MTSVLPASADVSPPPQPDPVGVPLRSADPRWARPAFFGLLAATALLYLWGLGSNGWSNSYYSAATQAGTESWKAFLFGSFDAGNFITVDKPPAFLWLMELSGRVFGFSTWSMLVPQALCGVLSVALLHATVRRWHSAPAALLAGAALAVTPIATLMFRYNNPDALLVLLLVAAAYATVRAVERASVGWLALAGVALGFGYLTKMLQALLLLPALALAYLIVAPTGLRTRIWHLLAAGGALIASAGWWIAIVELTPAGSRPYVGGSPTNSILELTFGYNGIGRLTGGEGNGGGPGFGGPAGFGRLFSDSFGGQASWLLPAALIAMVVLLWSSRRAPRTDRTRAAAIIWGGWLLVTGGVFSFMTGTIHEYYTIAFTPAVAALVGIAVPALWRERHRLLSRIVLAAMLGGTAAWSYVLLNRTPDFASWLRFAVLTAGVLAAVLVLLPLKAAGLRRPAIGAALVGGAVAVLAGPLSYSVQTVASGAHSGGIITAGPPSPNGGPAGFRGRPFPGGGFPGGGLPGGGLPGGGFPGGGFPGGGAPGGAPGGGAPGSDSPNGSAPTGGTAPAGGTPPAGGTAGPGLPGGGVGRGGGPGRQSVDAAVTALLKASPDSYRWAAAAVSANASADLQIASRKPIMAIGGFTGGDPAPTLAQFKQWVAAGDVHYFVVSGRTFRGGSPGGGFGRPGGVNSPFAVATFGEISNWVQDTFTVSTVGETTVYDLSAPKAL